MFHPQALGSVVPVLVVDTVVLSNGGGGELLGYVSPLPPFRKDRRQDDLAVATEPSRLFPLPPARPLGRAGKPCALVEPPALPVEKISPKHSCNQGEGGTRWFHLDTSSDWLPRVSSLSHLRQTVLSGERPLRGGLAEGLPKAAQRGSPPPGVRRVMQPPGDRPPKTA